MSLIDLFIALNVFLIQWSWSQEVFELTQRPSGDQRDKLVGAEDKPKEQKDDKAEMDDDKGERTKKVVTKRETKRAMNWGWKGKGNSKRRLFLVLILFLLRARQWGWKKLCCLGYCAVFFTQNEDFYKALVSNYVFYHTEPLVVMIWDSKKACLNSMRTLLDFLSFCTATGYRILAMTGMSSLCVFYRAI